jgi:hypothetical protein
MSDKKNIVFPNRIKVSGLPFMLQGWNNIYTKIDQMTDDCPIYELQSYLLYGLFPIIGTIIYRKDGIWQMQRECDYHPNGIKKYGGSQEDPFGFWSHGAIIAPYD